MNYLVSIKTYQEFTETFKFKLMATYRGKKVTLNKVTRGDVKKFKVFVKKGNRVVKVNFGSKNMKIKSNIPARKRSFLARHKCSTAKDRTNSKVLELQTVA